MPENQNMQKTSDNEAMLQEIVQNTEMGKNTLDELMGLTYDQKLKDEMMRQKNEYRRLNQQAHTALDAIGAQAKGQSAAARMSVSMGIRTRTMLDKSTRNLATMLAEGSGQGVLVHSPLNKSEVAVVKVMLILRYYSSELRHSFFSLCVSIQNIERAK